jgi:hypothetical protein
MSSSSQPEPDPTLGRIRLFSWAGFWCVLCLVVYFIALPNLPSEVAIHWGADGTADGSAPVWMILFVAGLCIAVGVLLSIQFRINSEPSMEAFAILGMMGGLALAVTLLTAVANWGIADWQDAASLSVWSIVAVFVIPMIGLFVGIVMGRVWYPIKDLPVSRAGSDVEMTEIAKGERVSWVGRARVRWLSLTMFGFALVFLFVFPDLPLWILLPLIGLGLVFTQVEANVTNDGLKIRLGGLPVRRIAIDAISSARAIDLEPAEWGGWGWRFAPGRSAIVLRRGDALEVTFNDGKRFAITVDTPGEGAALLNGLVALAGPGGPG